MFSDPGLGRECLQNGIRFKLRGGMRLSREAPSSLELGFGREGTALTMTTFLDVQKAALLKQVNDFTQPGLSLTKL